MDTVSNPVTPICNFRLSDQDVLVEMLAFCMLEVWLEEHLRIFTSLKLHQQRPRYGQNRKENQII